MQEGHNLATIKTPGELYKTQVLEPGARDSELIGREPRVQFCFKAPLGDLDVQP